MNIVTYVHRFGQETFDQRPFSRVDSLVLSQISYLCFSNVLNEEKTELFLGELSDPKLCEAICFETLVPKKNKSFVKAISLSPRYKDLKVTYFVRKDCNEANIQFAAMTFLSELFAYVAFRGTDITINGWKEDLNLVIYDVIPSQQDAKNYLEDVFLKIATYDTIYVGGHSKGGNLALYASIYVLSAFQEKITRVFDHDGPGFKKKIFSTTEFKRIENRIDKMVPQSSVIGILLNYYDQYSIVKSQGVLGLFQHDPFNWQIDRKTGDFVSYKRRTKSSKALDISFNSFLDSLNEDQRSFLVKKIFNLFDEAGIKTVKELKSKGFTLLRTYRRLYKNDNEEERKKIDVMLRQVARLYLYHRFAFRKVSKKKYSKSLDVVK